jgi:EAL and modified HD-GYP domain-containing signal transduction protein
VIEILESVLPEQQVVDAVAKLRGDGYTVALDDFVHDETLEPLIALADVIKIDVLTASPEQIRQQVDVLAAFPGTLLAEKVETHETLEHCRRLGFELFQGYALEKPRLVTGARVSAEASIRMQLVARLNEPGVGFDELARLIQADLALSYRLLRFVNSAHVGLRRQVESIKDALIVLGQRTIRSWATLLLLSDVDTNRHELVVTALGRAHTCEHLARSTGEDADGAFLVGLLSVADALLDRPLDEIAGELPISARLRGALLERDGPLGDLLARSLAYEQGDFTTALAAPLDPPTVSGAYLEGIAAAARLIGLRMEL